MFLCIINNEYFYLIFRTNLVHFIPFLILHYIPVFAEYK